MTTIIRYVLAKYCNYVFKIIDKHFLPQTILISYNNNFTYQHFFTQHKEFLMVIPLIRNLFFQMKTMYNIY